LPPSPPVFLYLLPPPTRGSIRRCACRVAQVLHLNGQFLLPILPTVILSPCHPLTCFLLADERVGRHCHHH
jgi:hypothetical protein